MVLLLLADFGEKDNLFYSAEEVSLAQRVQLDKLATTTCIIVCGK